VGRNSIQCTKCLSWIHRKCSGVKGSLVKVCASFVCRTCLCPLVKRESDACVEIDDGSVVERVDKFCYLGDMLCVEGGADTAIRSRLSKGWHNFRQLAPFVTAKDIPHHIRGNVYTSCVRSCMLHASETWPVKKENVTALERAEMRMVRWICGVKILDKIPGDILRRRLRIEGIGTALQRNRLRWFGHVQRKSDDDWVKQCLNFVVVGHKSRGCPRNTWTEVVEGDLRTLGLQKDDALDK